jgi:hypothetical protein
MRIEDFLALPWSEPGGPLIEPLWFSPLIVDPSFFFPEESIAGLHRLERSGNCPAQRHRLFPNWKNIPHGGITYGMVLK